jgi:tetratricopeptide (TPR) repeat protein
VRHAGFVWDDDAHVTRPDLMSLRGLGRIWVEPGATQQYYPVLHTFFWLEGHLWGYSSGAYHLANVLLHAGVACLLYRALRRLSVPGALLGAGAFALHPVCVESVAWVSEEKNTLSALLYLAAALAYLRFDGDRGRGRYGLATAVFVLALLTKSVTATLPAALLVVVWWRRGRIRGKRDVLPLLPWFALGAAAGAMTAWIERTRIGAEGSLFALSAAGRLLVAGRAIWFYLAKLAWPADLVFIYPRWAVDPASVRQYLFPLAALAVLAGLLALRGRARGPLAAALLFAGTLFPALGFANVYPFRFSYVADHFQYLAAALLLPAAAAGITLGLGRLPRAARGPARAGAYGLVAALAALTWRQTAMYADLGTLWQTTIARNPRCWMAYNNLGVALMAGGQTDEAIAQYRRAAEIEPGFAGVHSNLGAALLRQGRAGEAITELETAQRIEPGDVETHNNLGMALRREGRLAEAIAQYGQALAIKPGDFGANFNLGNALLQAGRGEEAIARYQRALEASPDSADTHNNLGNALRRAGRLGEAIAQYRQALASDPGHARAQAGLAAALAARGR